MGEDTIFGKIARGEVQADVVYEDESCVAFRDLNPQAPTHVLVIPRKPVVSIADWDADAELLGALLVACTRVARILGIEDGGYRVVTNVGANAGQSVAHLHFHVLGGRAMTWPPG
jgi:histidine triad (HIT) family protein